MLKTKADGTLCKGIYHSDLRKIGEVKVRITSGVLTSKYKEEGQAGHYYVTMSHEGQEHQYQAEGREDASVLAGHTGNEVTILAEGYSNDKTATLKVNGSSPAPPPTGKATTSEIAASVFGGGGDPVTNARSVAIQARDAYSIAIGEAKKLERAYNEKYNDDGDGGRVMMPLELFLDSVRSIIIHMSNRGVISHLPVRERNDDGDGQA